VITLRKSLQPPPVVELEEGSRGEDGVGEGSIGSKAGAPMRVTCVRYRGCALIRMLPDRRPEK
jgi:hypothetical protein